MGESSVATWEAKFSPTIQDRVRPLTDCQPHPDNARKHKLDKIKQSLIDHGQRTMVVVQQSSGYVVKGNGTWEAARQLGWETLAQDWQDLDDVQAFAYLLADNKASDGSEYDVKKLRAGLEKMVAGPGLESTLWEVDELEDLIAQDESPTVEAEFKGGFAESEESRAQRVADAESAVEGQKRREIPLVFTVADHALFVGWVKVLQKRWGIGGVMATVFAAVKRQAEAEAGVVVVGKPTTESSSRREQQFALGEFRDLLTTLGQEQYSLKWLVDQLNMQIGPTDATPTVAQAEQPADADLPDGEVRDLPSHLENLTAFDLDAPGEPVVPVYEPAPDEPPFGEEMVVGPGATVADDREALEALAIDREERTPDEPPWLAADLPVDEPESEGEGA